jgi:phospholipid/cholesterol/gamma-HCH transport system ATP-binding protein
MADKPIIEGRNVTVAYNGRVILDNVSFEVFPGEVFVIVGGSGCGKSTLLRQIIGLENPTEGEIFIDGDCLSRARGEERRKILRKFGVLFQSSGLFASMSLEENIDLVLENFSPLNKKMRRDMIDLKLRSVGLDGFQHFLPNEISGGMKKRAALARAMALDPKILCFDEPSSGLDPVTAAALDDLINEINRNLGTTMVVVTHDLESIFSISSRVILLDKEKKGQIATGDPRKLKQDKENIKVYNFFNRISK